MTSFSNGVWRQAQNVRTPGWDMLLSARIQGLTPNSQAVQLFTIADPTRNPAQIVGSPTNTAWTSSPTIQNNEPQQGARFFLTSITLADPNGSLRDTGNIVLNINNLDQGGVVVNGAVTISGGSSPTADGQATTYPVGGGLYGANSVNAIKPYDRLQLSIQTPSNTTSTATALTVILHGMWVL